MNLMDKKLDLQTIKKYAPARALERGYDYYQSGLVSSVKEYKGVISAKVKGQQTYIVHLHIEVDDDFDYSCTCPMGDEGEFCKHCVAVALTWINRNEKKKSTKNSYEVTLKDIENYLNTLDKTTLVDLLMQQAQENDMLCKKLGFHAAQAVSGEFDETAYGTYFTGRQKPTLQFLETPVWESIVVWRMRNGKKWIMLHPGCAGRIPISHRILCTSWKRWRSCPVMSRNW